MKPAVSVIFLTTLIGVGQGLFVSLYLVQAVSTMEYTDPEFYVTGSLISLGFLLAGLFASFFHLGRPERAWRAAAMWRTSWLSREVIVLPLLMLAIACYAALHGFHDPHSGSVDWAMWVGGVGIFLTALLFLSTAMIYACIRFLQEWASPFTVSNFTLLGLASGTLLAASYAGWSGYGFAPALAKGALLLIVLAMISKSASLWRNSRIRHKSTTQTAIGIRHNRIRQQSVGFMGGSFNTKAFFHGKSPGFVDAMVRAYFVALFIVPFLLVVVSLWSGYTGFGFAGFCIMYIGLIMERWHFFVEAKHPQNLYYQTPD